MRSLLLPHNSQLRPPRPEDAPWIWRLVRAAGRLDLNSPYAYLLLCSDFASTCLVAGEGARTLGFVAAYRPPTDPDSLFVWQIATAREARGLGLGTRMLQALIALPACDDARYLEATVTPSNTESRALFRRFAERQGAEHRERHGFGPELFPEADHETEIRLRIGPLRPRRTREENCQGARNAELSTSRV
jgi:L-2,4-diaminobutyric acid acetyltransferase